MARRKNLIAVLLGMVATVVFVIPVFASTTDGTIDSTSKWAWSEKIGWINFGVASGNVHITDSVMTGYAWNDLYGWINLNPSSSGVTNNDEGTLSGYAWGENFGWIDFTGVMVSNMGVFTGTASGTNTGVINFSCANCSVVTDWRPASARGTGETPPSSPIPPSASAPPSGSAIVSINGGVSVVNTTTVTVNITAPPDTSYAWISEDPNFVNNAVKADFVSGSLSTSTIYTLSEASGAKTIFSKFCNQWGYCGTSASVTFILTPAQVGEPAQVPPQAATSTPKIPSAKPSPLAEAVDNAIDALTRAQLEIIDKLKEITGGLVGQLSKIPRFKLPVVPIAKVYDRVKLWMPYLFKEKPLQKVPIETFVSKTTPLAFGSKWEYIDPKKIQRFVFAPLPKEFVALAKKFPEVSNTFKQVGINRMSDMEKIKSAQLYLPGLTRATGLETPAIGAAKSVSPKSIPVGQMPKFMKEKIPQEVVFARAGGQLVDFKIALSLTKKGQAEQKINTISGKQIQLTVKPGKPVKRVRGFVVFKSKKPQARSEMQFEDMMASLVFAEPALAYEQQIEVPVEEKLVLLEFDYIDPDGDGIYTADINAPIPAGEYEIITVMDYEDPELGSKQIKLITVVDPEGYVFEKIGDKELRVPGAIVTLFYFNPENKRYEEWPAKDYQQENPQITDVRGTYSFLVPGGTYYTQVEAPGYLAYQTKPYQVEEGGGVHMNVELKPKYWWLKIIDWKTGLLVLVALLLLYNFYKDKQRNKNKS